MATRVSYPVELKMKDIEMRLAEDAKKHRNKILNFIIAGSLISTSSLNNTTAGGALPLKDQRFSSLNSQCK
ncbi:hypothetical protein BK129_06795 [Paenibacillus amylolyticus]|uniref:hypothetical protein n=1 Tax=Paenibacillus amylolyticus TaxID=1451 RepID=UPI00096D8DA6|nr:hypothetical protein [Paenibacillus amylolyticus]OMF07507.1 hypothetical protein BK129_06795 [Paenibacillus amylolyticus]